MNRDIAIILKNLVEPLGFSDKIAGLVQTIHLVERISDDKSKKLSFPVSCDIQDLQDCVNNGRYKDLVPNDAYKSIVYFEDFGLIKTGTRGKNDIYNSRLRLVCWMNGQRLGKTDCSTASEAIKSILNVIPRNNANYGEYQRLRISMRQQVVKSKAIFSKYTYNDHMQYLIYPFDYFALDFDVSFHLNRDCLGDFQAGEYDKCNTI